MPIIQTVYIMGNSSASCISSGGRISERVSVHACTAKPTLQRRVEGHGANAHHCVAQIGHDVNWRLGVQETVADALEAQVHEHQVCDSVHELGAVVRDVVVLPTVSSVPRHNMEPEYSSPLHTSSGSRCALPRSHPGPLCTEFGTWWWL